MKKRPTTASVFGILNIVIGGIGILGNLCGVGGLAFMSAVANQPAPNNPMLQQLKELSRALLEEVPGFVQYMIAELVVGVIYSALLIASGIGLLQMKRWARSAAIAGSAVLLISQGGALAYQLAVLTPVMEGWQQRQPEPNPLAMTDPVSNTCGTVFYLIYGVVLLIFMFTPSMAAAFGGERHARDEYYDDDPDYQHRRDEHS